MLRKKIHCESTCVSCSCSDLQYVCSHIANSTRVSCRWPDVARFVCKSGCRSPAPARIRLNRFRLDILVPTRCRIRMICFARWCSTYPAPARIRVLTTELFSIAHWCSTYPAPARIRVVTRDVRYCCLHDFRCGSRLLFQHSEELFLERPWALLSFVHSLASVYIGLNTNSSDLSVL